MEIVAISEYFLEKNALLQCIIAKNSICDKKI